MEIQKGIVKYKDRNDIVCTYGVTADGRQYYFIGEDDKQLKNGNRIASTALVEAIDPMVKASNVGLVDENGNEVIAFENRMIKPINDDIILVEKAQPVSDSVIAAINLKSDPTEAARLVSTPATIKGKLNAKMGPEGRYFFNDQFSEATVYDINGNNLVNDEYFSFIGMADGKLYFSKNTEDSEITEYSVLPPEVQSDVTPASDTNEIDISEVEVSKDIVENALNNEVVSSETVEKVKEEANLVENNVSEDGEKKESEVIHLDMDDESTDSSENEKDDSEDKDSSIEVSEDSSLDSDTSSDADEVGDIDISSEEESEVEKDETEEADETSADSDDDNYEEEADLDIVVNDAEEEKDTTEEINNDDIDVEVEEDNDKEDDVSLSLEINDEEEKSENVENDLVAFANSSVSSVAEESADNHDGEDAKEEENTEVHDTDEVKNEVESTEGNITIAEEYDMEQEVSDGEEEESEDEYEDSEIDVDLDDTAEDVFKDSVLKADKIVAADNAEDEEFNVVDIEVAENDSIIADVANSMNSLINQNKKQKAAISQYKEQLDKLNTTKRNMEVKITKLESQNKVLENKIHEQEKIIANQAKELGEIRPQLEGKDELVKLLADAQVLLGQDSYDYGDSDSYYKRVA